ncbi:MAG: lytic transglycosylase domain-containing protein [Pseudomonadota bacterium]|nr:lytic transglycosylase domain-containing protein [Pseudomonadota bacterium]
MHLIKVLVVMVTLGWSGILYASNNDLKQCVSEAAGSYGLPQILVYSILGVEGGKVGMEKQNPDYSYDLGLMQINDGQPWFRVLKGNGITREALVSDGCVNIWSGSFILASEIYQAKDFWRGVGNYHNRREPHHSGYIQRVKNHWKAILKKSSNNG